MKNNPLFFISDRMQGEILRALSDTLQMTLISGVFIIIIGLVLGFLLFYTDVQLEKNPQKAFIHKALSIVIDIFRSVPFLVLLVVLIPFTRWLVGTMLGVSGAVPSLVISASPFFARLVYMALREIPKGNIEALDSLGCSRLRKTLYLTKEASSALVSAITVTLVTLIGFSTVTGAIGAGGLGYLAQREMLASFGDFQRRIVAYVCVAIIIIIVLIVQFTGDFISKKIDKR